MASRTKPATHATAEAATIANNHNAITGVIIMAGRQSAETTRALRMVDKGMTAYAAAKKVGIDLRTIYRALKRRRNAAQNAGLDTAGHAEDPSSSSPQGDARRAAAASGSGSP